MQPKYRVRKVCGLFYVEQLIFDAWAVTAVCHDRKEALIKISELCQYEIKYIYESNINGQIVIALGI